MGRVFRITLLLIISLVVFSCAQVVAPTGGEKDKIPPEVIGSSPENGQKNFTETEIIISFDEYIKLLKLKDELIVSPPLKYSLITKIKGKDLIIEIKDTLKENTTYVLNFGNAIVDLRENNPLPNFTYVFSTGNEIDSLSISGRIINSFDAKVEKDVLFMLYAAEEDSLPLKELPNYIGRTDKEGLFNVGNIKAGSYKVFALKDGNKNYLFDRPDENIAFDTNRIDINSNVEFFNMYLFEEDNAIQFVKDQKETGANVIFNFNRVFDTITFEGLDTNLAEISFIKQIGENKESISIWFKEMDKVKTRLIVSDLNKFTDTISVKIDSSFKKLGLSISSNANYFKPTELQFRSPLKSFNKDLIKVFDRDSLEVELSFQLSENNSSMELNYERNQDSTYSVLILPGAFTDYYNRTNDTLQKSFRFNSEKDFGTLKLNLNSSIQEPKLIQLLDVQGTILRESEIKNSEVLFKNLVPGKYRLKCILDRNNNGQWDTGEYLNKLMPEKVILFEEEVSIRSNWDKELTWNIEL